MKDIKQEIYQPRGIGMAVSALILVAFVFGWPAFWKQNNRWDNLRRFAMDDHGMTIQQFYTVYAFLQGNIIYWTLVLIYYFIYTSKSPFFERYKVDPSEPWPWEKDQQKWRAMLWKCLPLVLLNAFVISTALSCTSMLMDEPPLKMDFSQEGIPGPSKFFLQVLFCAIMEDMTFYFSHRTLHHPRLYPHIHKIHHRFTQTTVLATQYAHPIEFVFGNLLPIAAGPALLGPKMHLTTAFAWYVVRVIESTEGHSGYEFSWSPFRLLPFTSDYGYHAFHHSHQVGNYSSFFTIWDSIFKSNTVYHEHIKQINANAAKVKHS